MPTETTYTQLRANLAAILNEVTEDQDVVIVRRKNQPDIALIFRLQNSQASLRPPICAVLPRTRSV